MSHRRSNIPPTQAAGMHRRSNAVGLFPRAASALSDTFLTFERLCPRSMQGALKCKEFVRQGTRRMLRVWAVLLLLLCSPGGGADELLTADEIVRRTHEAAGGEEWVRPHTLYLLGSSTFFEGTSATHMDRHEMWRVFESRKESAHQASGKVRIRSSQEGVTRVDLAFDGTTANVNGAPSGEPSDSQRWASNFGFGVVRHAARLARANLLGLLFAPRKQLEAARARPSLLQRSQTKRGPLDRISCQ